MLHNVEREDSISEYTVASIGGRYNEGTDGNNESMLLMGDMWNTNEKNNLSKASTLSDQQSGQKGDFCLSPLLILLRRMMVISMR